MISLWPILINENCLAWCIKDKFEKLNALLKMMSFWLLVIDIIFEEKSFPYIVDKYVLHRVRLIQLSSK